MTNAKKVKKVKKATTKKTGKGDASIASRKLDPVTLEVVRA